MKRFSYIIVIMVALAGLLQGSSLIAQQPYRSYFGEEFTKWYIHSETGDFWKKAYFIGNKKDSVVNVHGKEYKIVREYIDEDMTQITYYNSFYFLREKRESGKLYYLFAYNPDIGSEGVEILISDMSLQVGDTFRLETNFDDPHLYNGWCRDKFGYFTRVDSVYYKGGRKHIQTALVKDWDKDKIPFTFIEGLGPNYSIDFLLRGHSWFKVLTCYYTEKEFWQSEEFWNTPPNSSGDCIKELGIKEIKQPAPFKIAQSSGSIEALFETGVNGRVALYNMQAQQLWSKQTGRELSIQIPTAGLSAGIYLLWVFDNERNRSWTEKVVVK